MGRRVAPEEPEAATPFGRGSTDDAPDMFWFGLVSLHIHTSYRCHEPGIGVGVEITWACGCRYQHTGGGFRWVDTQCRESWHTFREPLWIEVQLPGCFLV